MPGRTPGEGPEPEDALSLPVKKEHLHLGNLAGRFYPKGTQKKEKHNISLTVQ
jgi:hypothetical protein